MDKKLSFHYVCTRSEAEELIEKNSKFWVSNCGCREKKGQCDHSSMYVCLFFKPDMRGTGSGFKEGSRALAAGILEDAREKQLVTRPFRDEKEMSETQGICFCCDDCCEYFNNSEELCDKGQYIEKTDFDVCTHCGECVDVCYFMARSMDRDELIIDQSKCYGCGLCQDACPLECIDMTPREEIKDEITEELMK